MNENLQEAFIILAVGMITVFIILALVVFTGQILIRITNQYAPPSLQKEISPPPIPIKNENKSSVSSGVDTRKLAAIIGVVEHLTNGKGRIENIEKI